MRKPLRRNKPWLALLFAPALAAQTVTVTGTVTNALTHEPIPGVAVWLQHARWAGGHGSTDAAGAFRIDNVQPGTYQLRASTMGFEDDGSEVRIEAGGATLHVTMMPRPGLRGRVLDDQRHGVARAEVEAWKRGDSAALPTTADEEGRYSFDHLAPGEYTLLANPTATTAALAPTYFPNGAAKEEASRVTVSAGADLTGYDIVLRRVPVFRVSGKVVDERGEPATGATVQMTTAVAKVRTGDDGTFELAAVRPGDGRLTASVQRDGVELRGFGAVMVTSHDVEYVTVRVATPVAIGLTVELDGRATARCEAALTPVEGHGERARATVSESGIRFERVYPGRYRLSFFPYFSRPSRFYVDSFRLGERDITLDEFEVGPGMPPFRVVLGTNGGHVRGTVEDGDGGILVLVPRDERLRFMPFVAVSIFDGSQFDIDNVRPGDYYAFVVRGSFNAGEMQNPFYAEPRLAGAPGVRVEAGGTATLTLLYVKLTSSQ
jgi:protocatechuate 3,4-dioxygenase beta subunit